MKGGVGVAAALAGALRGVMAAVAGRERPAALAAQAARHPVPASTSVPGGRPATSVALTAAVLAAAALAPAATQAQNTHILLISGLGGDPEYTDAFHGWLSRFADAATEKYGVPPRADHLPGREDRPRSHPHPRALHRR